MHDIWIQEVALDGTNVDFTLHWQFSSAKTLAQRFQDAVFPGELVTWTITDGATTQVINGTWRFSNGAGITVARFDTSGTHFSNDDGIWGAGTLVDGNSNSDVATVTVGVFFVGGQVPIDIMPNTDGNNLNLRAGQGAGIDIAILSVGEFFEAPNEIDPLTLKFGPREANIWGSAQVRDVDGDGDDDLTVKFLIQQTGIACGDTHASLTGRTFDSQSISGSDAINTFNCPRVRKRR